jgi:hypothetical protein
VMSCQVRCPPNEKGWKVRVGSSAPDQRRPLGLYFNSGRIGAPHELTRQASKRYDASQQKLFDHSSVQANSGLMLFPRAPRLWPSRGLWHESGEFIFQFFWIDDFGKIDIDIDLMKLVPTLE